MIILKIKNPDTVRKVFAVALLLAISVVYIATALLIYRDQDALEKAQVSTDQQEAIQHWHSAPYERQVAERLQFSGHDPRLITQLYQRSISSGPASYETFFSFAYYLLSRNCCQKEVLAMLEETLRRCPTNPRMHRVAASYMMASEHKEKAFPYFKRALELHPASAREVYIFLEQNRIESSRFVEVTPDRAESLLQLADYLFSRGSDWNGVLARLQNRKMKPSQHLEYGKLLLNAHWYVAAKDQAKFSAADADLKPEALKLLAEISWQEHDYSAFERYADLVEQAYLQNGSRNDGAQYALSTANRIAESNPGKAKERLVKMLSEYPQFGPAYYQLAVSSRESKDLMLYYLKKAAEFSPEYKLELASTYLEDSRNQEAEQIYSQLATDSQFRSKAIAGLAKCKLRKGDTAGALLFLREGLQNTPDSPDIVYAMAQIYITLSDYENAAASYLRYAELTPSDPSGFNQAADAYVNLGEYNRAREYYQLALQRDPQNTHAIARLQSLNF